MLYENFIPGKQRLVTLYYEVEAIEVEAKGKKSMHVRQHAKITAPYCGTAKATTVS